ncbi:hypothetical protein EDC02_7816 [Micromonospora sp. Llam0]|nr:hypothetical protein EDC02_7816 [Micromonospora sp. Llam0]
MSPGHDDEMGNRAGTATTISRLGNPHAETGNPAQH